MLAESKMELFTSTRALYNMCCVSAVVVGVVFVHIENRPGLSVHEALPSVQISPQYLTPPLTRSTPVVTGQLAQKRVKEEWTFDRMVYEKHTSFFEETDEQARIPFCAPVQRPSCRHLLCCPHSLHQVFAPR